MKKFWHRLRAWYLRRFRGFVAATVPGGTSWQEHRRGRDEMFFWCRCGLFMEFYEKDLFVRNRRHTDNCPALWEDSGAIKCDCPITDARYVKICPDCHLGHWMDASPKGTK